MGASWETTSFALRAAGSRDEQQEVYAIVSQILLLLAPLCKSTGKEVKPRVFQELTEARVKRLCLHDRLPPHILRPRGPKSPALPRYHPHARVRVARRPLLPRAGRRGAHALGRRRQDLENRDGYLHRRNHLPAGRYRGIFRADGAVLPGAWGEGAGGQAGAVDEVAARRASCQLCAHHCKLAFCHHLSTASREDIKADLCARYASSSAW